MTDKMEHKMEWESCRPKTQTWKRRKTVYYTNAMTTKRHNSKIKCVYYARPIQCIHKTTLKPSKTESYTILNTLRKFAMQVKLVLLKC